MSYFSLFLLRIKRCRLYLVQPLSVLSSNKYYIDAEDLNPGRDRILDNVASSQLTLLENRTPRLSNIMSFK